MADLVGNPEDRFSHDEVQLLCTLLQKIYVVVACHNSDIPNEQVVENDF